MLDPNFREFVELLEEKEVEYLIIGGYAVAFHGFPRSTGDFDIWINSTPDNAKKMVEVFDAFGMGSLGLKNEDFAKKGNIIQIGYPPLRIDVINDISGVKFEDCYPVKVIGEIDGTKMNFIPLSALLQNKKSVGRPEDIKDVKNLEKQLKKKRKK